MVEISNSVKAATTDIGALLQERDQLRARNAEIEAEVDRLNAHAVEVYKENRKEYLVQQAEVERLRKAIATHKNNVWGRHEVAHNEDVVLYTALEASDG